MQPLQASLVVYTVGHSNRTLEEFVALLQSAAIETVVDVRSFPRSRRNPQYDLDALPGLLAAHAIGHEHVAELGGRRGKSRVVPPEVNALWENQGFHNYADYALSEAFGSGLDRVVTIAAARRSAVMCSEAVWWRCHRRIVTDHLLARGHTVLHLMGAGAPSPASLMRGAVVTGDRVTYPSQPAALE